MGNYITEFNQSGISTVNVDKICKDWNDRFSILTFQNHEVEKYTLLIKGKRKNTILCKTQISSLQAFSIANRLDLFHVKSSISKSAGSFHTKSFILGEIRMLTELKNRLQLELESISRQIAQFMDIFG